MSNTDERIRHLEAEIMRMKRQPSMYKPAVFPDAERRARPWTYLTTPLTSTSWSGDDTVAVGTTTIDTSAVFSAPVSIKAVLVFFRVKWAAGSKSSYMLIRPLGATRYAGIVYAHDTMFQIWSGIVPCDANGDISVTVANADATEVLMEIWGYLL